MPEPMIPTPSEQARAATKEGVGRYVLGISLGLAIIALIVAYVVVV
ncbi:MAG TPA: hypothetical protein VGG57_22730 [Stellaceae bacterium]